MVVVAEPVKRAERGYVLLVVILLSALVVSTGAAYARHAAANWRTSTASLWTLESRESAQSGVAFARQALAAGTSSASVALQAGNKPVLVEIADAGGEVRTIRVQSTDGGLGATVIGRADVIPLAGGALPTLHPLAGLIVAVDGSRTILSGTATLVGQDFPGTVVLSSGSNITLEDCVVAGTIVSAPALLGTWTGVQVTQLTVRGRLSVTPSWVLPGCAIVMPDGELVFEPGASVELRGAVVARAIDFAGGGALHGHVVAAQPFLLPAGFEQPGFGRTPPAWPVALQFGARGIARLGFPCQSISDAAKSAIQGYEFP